MEWNSMQVTKIILGGFVGGIIIWELAVIIDLLRAITILLQV